MGGKAMSEFKSNPQLDEAINGAMTPSDLREKMLQTLAAQGTVVRSRDDQFNNRLVIRQPEPQPAVALPANPATCVRTIYPAGNNRFEIYGASEQELDEKERQIRAMF